MSPSLREWLQELITYSLPEDITRDRTLVMTAARMALEDAARECNRHAIDYEHRDPAMSIACEALEAAIRALAAELDKGA